MDLPEQVILRKADDRGSADHGWLDTHHTFSFARYYDPNHMGFRSLRVINQDKVAPGAGFPPHSHSDMEILSYVVEGSLEHKDDMGNGSIIPTGGFQLMSAGTGVTHSEFNPSSKDKVHFLQIWIIPNEGGLKPSYNEIPKEALQEGQKLTLVASPEGKDKSMVIHQDAKVYLGRMKKGDIEELSTTPERGVWVQLIRGTMKVQGKDISPGDGISVEKTSKVRLEANSDALFILFDLL